MADEVNQVITAICEEQCMLADKVLAVSVCLPVCLSVCLSVCLTDFLCLSLCDTLPCSRHRLSYNECVEDKREDSLPV